jgi:cell division protein FtsQ
MRPLTGLLARRMAAASTGARRRPRLRRRPDRRVVRWSLAAVVGLALGLAATGQAREHGGALAAWHALTGRAGFEVAEVLVTGRHHTEPAALLEALRVTRGDPLFRLDPEAARRRIEALPWIAEARVERRLPDTLLVHVVERRPMALWQHDRRLRLIDAEGVVLSERDLARFAHLPHVVGADAHRHAHGFLALLAAHPTVFARVGAAIRVGDRRWDLRLDNGVTVRLPQGGTAEALVLLARLQAEEAVFDRDVLSIDMRLPDRLFIRTTPAARERRILPEEST